MFSSFLRDVRLFDRNVRTILLVAAVLAFIVDGVYPVIFNLYILRMGYGPEFVGQANSVALLVYSLSSLAAGALGTRFGLRTAMVAGVAITLVGAGALAVTDLVGPELRSGWILLFFSLLYLGVALYFVNSPAALVNATPATLRSRVISTQSALGNLFAFIAGSLAGLIPVALSIWLGWSLTSPLPYRIPLLLTVALCAVALVFVLRLRPIVTHAEQGEVRAGGGAPPVAIGFAGTLLILSLIRFLQTAGSGSALTFLNVYMDDGLGVSTALIGAIVAVAHLIAVFMALAVPAITRRLGYGRAAVVGAIGVALSLLPLALIPLWQAGGLGYISMSALTSLRYTAFFVYSMEASPPQRRAMMAGAGEFAGGLSFALISLAGGYLIVRAGYPALFLIGAALSASGAVALALYLRYRHRHAVRHARQAPAAVHPVSVVEPAVLE